MPFNRQRSTPMCQERSGIGIYYVGTYIIHMPHSEAEDKLTMAHSLAHSGHFQLDTPSKNLP